MFGWVYLSESVEEERGKGNGSGVREGGMEGRRDGEREREGERDRLKLCLHKRKND